MLRSRASTSVSLRGTSSDRSSTRGGGGLLLAGLLNGWNQALRLQSQGKNDGYGSSRGVTESGGTAWNPGQLDVNLRGGVTTITRRPPEDVAEDEMRNEEVFLAAQNLKVSFPTNKAMTGTGIPKEWVDETTTPPTGYKLPLEGNAGSLTRSNVPDLLGYGKDARKKAAQAAPKKVGIRRSKTREFFLAQMDTHKNEEAANRDTKPRLGEGDLRLEHSSAADRRTSVTVSSGGGDVSPSSYSTSSAVAELPEEGEKSIPYRLHNEDREQALWRKREELAKAPVIPSSPVDERMSPFYRRTSKLEGEVAATPLGELSSAEEARVEEVKVGEKGFVLQEFKTPESAFDPETGLLMSSTSSVENGGGGTARYGAPTAASPDGLGGSKLRVAPIQKRRLNTGELVDLADDAKLSEEGREWKAQRAEQDVARKGELDEALGLHHEYLVERQLPLPPSMHQHRGRAQLEAVEKGEEFRSLAKEIGIEKARTEFAKRDREAEDDLIPRPDDRTGITDRTPWYLQQGTSRLASLAEKATGSVVPSSSSSSAELPVPADVQARQDNPHPYSITPPRTLLRSLWLAVSQVPLNVGNLDRGLDYYSGSSLFQYFVIFLTFVAVMKTDEWYSWMRKVTKYFYSVENIAVRNRHEFSEAITFDGYVHRIRIFFGLVFTFTVFQIPAKWLCVVGFRVSRALRGKPVN